MITLLGATAKLIFCVIHFIYSDFRKPCQEVIFFVNVGVALSKKGKFSHLESTVARGSSLLNFASVEPVRSPFRVLEGSPTLLYLSMAARNAHSKEKPHFLHPFKFKFAF
jgi:hypothetical protein